MLLETVCERYDWGFLATFSVRDILNRYERKQPQLPTNLKDLREIAECGSMPIAKRLLLTAQSANIDQQRTGTSPAPVDKIRHI
ncbi:hypothetical protein KSX_39200 [Ktedonospora formicarum]|uniref:Uncharacterized protein n=1 Tax=Ktedonospora formicarum TaxID=2778364 RepID=A0A8J3I3Y6_9CHLR|nr:hypothetical protein KSX_39200 [Ktedonospora formicarum]